MTINNLNEAYELSGNQLTVGSLLHGRIYIDGEGWSTVELSPEFRTQLAEMIAQTLGGWHSTRAHIADLLSYSSPNHWGLDRIIVAKYGDKVYLTYVAGQDHVWETRQIRKYLLSL